MVSSPLISVIVPVYKVERYLPRCIESILAQTYSNFELILVDDGTPDRSGIICDRYAEKDSRIRVIHKENGGVSTARNAGIDAAKGEWITFVDSDDWVTDDYLDVLVSPLKKNNYDLIVGLLELRSIRIRTYSKDQSVTTPEEMNSPRILEMVDSMEFCGPCHKLFLQKYISEKNIRFPVGIAIAEDTVFVNDYLTYCKNIFVTGERIYFYNRSNEFSITRKYPYFEERCNWDRVYIDSYLNLLKKFNVKQELSRCVIVNKVLDMFCPSMRTIIINFDDVEAKNKIKSALPFYTTYITQGDEKYIKPKNQRYVPMIDFILTQNAESIYDFLQTPNKKAKYTKIKRFIKKSVRPFIERYRDGLKKFKF